MAGGGVAMREGVRRIFRILAKENVKAMKEVLEILKYLLPSLVVFLTVWYVLRAMFSAQAEQRRMELALENQKLITPIRLQAYERLVLFLERISPESLLLRVNRPGLTVQQLHQELLAAIRNEYEHNLSQQLYISPAAWEVVRNARGQILKLINTTYEEFKPEDPALDYSKRLFEKLVDIDKLPTQTAIDYLKKEVSRLF